MAATMGGSVRVGLEDSLYDGKELAQSNAAQVKRIRTILEGLSRLYGVDVVVSETTQAQASQFVWQELDRLRLTAGEPPHPIYTPLGASGELAIELRDELRQWQQALRAWRAQDWDACDVHLLNLQRKNAKKVLYRLYVDRVASRRFLPLDPAWDGAATLDSLQAPPSRTGSTGHTMSKSP